MEIFWDPHPDPITLVKSDLGSCWVGDVDPIGCPLLLVVARGGHVDVHPEPLPVVPEVLNDERVLILYEHLQHGQR